MAWTGVAEGALGLIDSWFYTEQDRERDRLVGEELWTRRHEADAMVDVSREQTRAVMFAGSTEEQVAETWALALVVGTAIVGGVVITWAAS